MNKIKLTKVVSDSGYSNYLTAEDTKYFTNITASKHYSYSVEFTLKDEFNSGSTNYHGINREYDLRLLKDVKKFISTIDATFEQALIQSKSEDDARELEWQNRKYDIEALNIFVGESYLPEIDQIINLKWANLNKNCTIGEYRKEVNDGDYQWHDAKVERVIQLSSKEYDEFALNLMDKHGFLSNGGSRSDDPRLDEYGDNWSNNDTAIKIFRQTSYNLVTAVVAEDRTTIYADPQGHEYARYVAFK